jgi:aspartate/methionine/tyrosine aminotransferase
MTVHSESTTDSAKRDVGPRYLFSAIRQRLREHKGEVVDFAMGRASDAPPEAALDLIRSRPELALRPARPAEHEAFAERAIDMLAREYGVRVSPQAILLTLGGRAAMSALAASLLRPRDVVLVTEPGYPAFAQLAASRDARVQAVPLDPKRGFAPDLGAIDSEGSASIAIAAMNYPNNPTGAPLSDRLLGFLRDSFSGETVLFNDATYGPLAYDAPPNSLLKICQTTDRQQTVLELHSFAKLFALGPLALSFLVGAETVVERVRRHSEFASSPASSLHVQIAQRCAQDAEHIGRTRQAFKDRTRRLRATLIRIGFDPYDTPSGMYVLCRLPSKIGPTPVATAQEAAELLLDEHGIAVVPWDVGPNHYLRFSASYHRHDLESLELLGPRLELPEPPPG